MLIVAFTDPLFVMTVESIETGIPAITGVGSISVVALTGLSRFLDKAVARLS
jgi:hypothetical protein